MKLLAVADGDRETQALPRLVEKVIGREVVAEFRTWSRLHDSAGKGYEKKLAYSIRQAQVYGSQGIVAVVDRDKDPSRTKLKKLQATRSRYREQGDLRPIALAEAIPHFEAWLLDDEKAVRTGLGLPTSTTIPNVRKVDSPKQALTELIGIGDDDEAVAEPLGCIAEQLEPARCPHAEETGFEGFVQDCRSEFQYSSPN